MRKKQVNARDPKSIILPPDFYSCGKLYSEISTSKPKITRPEPIAKLGLKVQWVGAKKIYEWTDFIWDGRGKRLSNQI